MEEIQKSENQPDKIATKGFQWRPEVILSLFSLGISLFSFVFIALQTNIMQKQQETSVWPYLEVSAGITGKGFYLKVKNKGVGPAIITDVAIEYKGLRFESVEKVAKAVVNDSTFNYNIYSTDDLDKTVISANEEVTTFSVSDMKFSTILINSTSDIKIIIDYTSIYGKKWRVTNKDVMPR